MAYVDGFVVPVPKKKLEDYRCVAEDAKRMIYGGFKAVVDV